MRNKVIAALLPALLLTTGTAAAQTAGPDAGKRADIPFVGNNIRTFTPDRRGEGVYLQDRRRNWYYASFFSRCHELPYAFGVGFKTFGGTLSRGDSILVGREQCRIADLVRSGPPPAKTSKAKADT